MSPFWKREKNKEVPTEVVTWEEASELLEKEEKERRLGEIKILEDTGRYKEAATSYEVLASTFNDERYYDKARELRNKARGLQVNVNYTDFNEFIRQLKESGGTVAYRCGKCGADLKIDGKSTGKCDYCGSELAILPELIKSMPLTLK